VDNSISLGDVAALVTTVGIAVYVMGLVGLAVTIWFNFTSDFISAWYAVSLLPRVVVAGQGVRLWLRWPIIATTILLPIAILPWTSPGVISALVTILSTIAFVFLSIAFRGSLPARMNQEGVWRLVWFGLGAYILILFGGLLLTVGLLLVAQEPSPATYFLDIALKALGIDMQKNSFAIGILLILLGGFAVGAPSAIVVRHPLPQVKLEIDDEASNRYVAMKKDSNSLEGWLVAHSDGYWHLFLGESKELQSIPDEQVRVARTGEEAHTAREERSCVYRRSNL
jgi:hypothetical protein